MDFKVKAKKDGKYWTFGQIKEGKFGPQLSFKNTPEVKALFVEGGDWVNFALFANDDKPRELPSDTQAMLDQLKQSANESEEIPF